MTYELRTATIDGEACSTCRCAVMKLDRYDVPLWGCMSLMTDAFDISTPDETVCDGWREKE